MVGGFTKFKERFQGFKNQYVIIGGTACDLIMENEELPFRATKDVDIVLIVESITAEFRGLFQNLSILVYRPLMVSRIALREGIYPSAFYLILIDNFSKLS